MLYERIDQNFQPSGTTITSCLSVRKQEFSVSGIKHPGLHELHGLAWDVTAVLVVVIAEMTGMFMLFSLFQTSNYPASQLLVGAVVLIVIDFVFAFFHHRFKAGTVTKLRAQILLLGADGSTESNADSANKEIAIKWRLRVAFLFAVLIVIFAMLKFMVYVSLAQTIYGSNLPGQYIALAFVLYSVTAVLHIKNTGQCQPAKTAVVAKGCGATLPEKREAATVKKPTEATALARYHRQWQPGQNSRGREGLRCLP